MLEEVRRKFSKQWFNFRCREILSTPSLKPKGSGLTIVSMVSHADLLMYLISIKSFYRYVGMGNIIVLDDGTLTRQDRRLLIDHLPSCEIVQASTINTTGTPSYISWKRLLFIAEKVQDSYVVQLDSDLLTSNNISEVIECINENRSFILGTWKNQKIEAMKESCKRAKTVDSNHVQVIAERNFDRLAEFDHLRYVRGCAAFSGFGVGSFARATVERFSREMYSLIGETWLNWGSEQTTSNYLVANAPLATVLPYPKYSGYHPKKDWQCAALMHFSGTHRFKKGIYVKRANEIIKDVNLHY